MNASWKIIFPFLLFSTSLVLAQKKLGVEFVKPTDFILNDICKSPDSLSLTLYVGKLDVTKLGFASFPENSIYASEYYDLGKKHVICLKHDCESVTIYSSIYGELNIILSDYKNYYKGNEITLELVPILKKADFSIISYPRGATITFEGFPGIHEYTPWNPEGYEARKYKIHCQLENYYPIDSSVQFFEGDNDTVYFFLKPIMGSLTLKSLITAYDGTEVL